MTRHMDVTYGWARHAARAATDRLAGHRPIDPAFVAQLEADAIAIAPECGWDVQDALDGLHVGLADAVRADLDRNPPSGGLRSPVEPPATPGVGVRVLQRFLDRVRESA